MAFTRTQHRGNRIRRQKSRRKAVALARSHVRPVRPATEAKDAG